MKDEWQHFIRKSPKGIQNPFLIISFEIPKSLNDGGWFWWECIGKNRGRQRRNSYLSQAVSDSQPRPGWAKMPFLDDHQSLFLNPPQEVSLLPEKVLPMFF